MLLLASGIVIFLIVFAIFWNSLPKDGRKYRFADTAWEPYVGVALTAGIALSASLILSGVFNIIGS
jgi:hypothetical protein